VEDTPRRASRPPPGPTQPASPAGPPGTSSTKSRRGGERQSRKADDQIKVDENLRADFNEVAGELGLPELATSARVAAQAVDEVRHGRLLATAKPWWRSPLVVGLTAFVIITAAGVVLAEDDRLAADLAGLDGGSPGQGRGAGRAAWLSRQTAQATSLLPPAEAIKAEIGQRVTGPPTQQKSRTPAPSWPPPSRNSLPPVTRLSQHAPA
jgi:hypothetical protein